jgi:hypothetical protein
MARSEAATVEEYLEELPEERREVVSAVRKLVRKHLPKGYAEFISFGMICWGIPLAKYPNTYNGQPLGYVALAAQKNAYSLYLMAPYTDPRLGKSLEESYREAGKKLDMGKSCLRFKKLDDLVPDAIGRVIASTPPAAFIEIYEANRGKSAGEAKAKRWNQR